MQIETHIHVFAFFEASVAPARSPRARRPLTRAANTIAGTPKGQQQKIVARIAPTRWLGTVPGGSGAPAAGAAPGVGGRTTCGASPGSAAESGCQSAMPSCQTRESGRIVPFATRARNAASSIGPFWAPPSE